MRHPILGALLLVVLVILAALSSYMPLAFLGQVILLTIAAGIGLSVMIALLFLVKGLLFGRAISRYDRFN